MDRWDETDYNYRLIRGRVVEFLVFYLYVCMFGLFDGVKISVKLSIQVNVILQICIYIYIYIVYVIFILK